MDPDDQVIDQLRAEVLRACLMEAAAPKPGNVHPGASFDDVTHADFVTSAEAVAPVLAQAGELGVGRTMLEAVRATRLATGSNTNLGIILLLAPLAAVPRERTLLTGIHAVLDELTIDDAQNCYAAIRLAAPGGIGTAAEADVAHEPRIGLVAAMRLAAGRDRIAAQYANGFRDVLERGLPLLADLYEGSDWRTSIVRLHLELMANLPDTLIARKCGWELSEESARRARRVLDGGWPMTSAGRLALERLDAWLREDGNRRNPGTTADLLAAILFAGLREGVIEPPSEIVGA